MNTETSTASEATREPKTAIALSEAIGFVQGLIAEGHFGTIGDKLVQQRIDYWRDCLSGDNELDKAVEGDR